MAHAEAAEESRSTMDLVADKASELSPAAPIPAAAVEARGSMEGSKEDKEDGVREKDAVEAHGSPDSEIEEEHKSLALEDVPAEKSTLAEDEASETSSVYSSVGEDTPEGAISPMPASPIFEEGPVVVDGFRDGTLSSATQKEFVAAFPAAAAEPVEEFKDGSLSTATQKEFVAAFSAAVDVPEQRSGNEEAFGRNAALSLEPVEAPAEADGDAHAEENAAALEDVDLETPIEAPSAELPAESTISSEPQTPVSASTRSSAYSTMSDHDLAAAPAMLSQPQTPFAVSARSSTRADPSNSSFVAEMSADPMTPVEPESPISIHAAPSTHINTSEDGFFAELSAEPITPIEPEPSSLARAPTPARLEIFQATQGDHEEAASPILQSPADSISTIDHSPSISSRHSSSSPATPIAETPVAPVSPLTRAETMNYRDSMASIALSESSLDYDHLSAEAVEQALTTPRASRHMRKPSSLEILQNMWADPAGGRPGLERNNTFFDATKEQPSPTPIETEAQNPWGDLDLLPRRRVTGQLRAPEQTAKWHKRTTSLNAPKWTPDTASEENVELDWQQLDKEEEWEKEDREGEGEDESTAFLLARLEQENAKISNFSMSVSSVEGIKEQDRTGGRRESKAPSRSLLKRMISDRNAPSIRYSLALPAGETLGLPQEVTEPPPMTELEFWAALVQDYPSTAARLPTLTTTKIRAGIPPPLRGVVWQSISGARDTSLEDSFDRLQHEQSPYEGIINKDVGRSFPGVELFRDAEGEGQKMLGRVLKCFSLHDKDIGYCQGLGFLVGPLLMNMGEREAFCVLVRLMEHYALRPSFLPSLSGLHMRIFQFSALVAQHLPELNRHLQNLGVEPAYLSQWFLSCFAVTCPLPMLFRIYDVIFAEGANETVMRVAMALMRRNEQKMMDATEFEEVMQLLLGRGIWDCYGVDADALVDDFTSLGGIITHARLAELEREFEKQSAETVGDKAGFLPDVQAAASRFLGRLWAPSHGASKSTSTLSPATAETEGKRRTAGLLRRSPSKTSISTLNDVTGSDGSSTNSSGTASLASTNPTDPEAGDAASPLRESQATHSDAMSFKSSRKADSMRTVSISTGHGVGVVGVSKEERDMHGQIEDLLTALGEMQREQASLVGLLQREREERGEDQVVVRRLVRKLRKESVGGGEVVGEKKGRRRTLPAPERGMSYGDGEDGAVRLRPKSVLVPSTSKRTREEGEVEELVESVAQRLETNTRFSHSFETKAELRSKLTRTREQLAAAETSSTDLSARLQVAETSLAAFTTEADDLRAEVKELRIRVNEEFKTRQKLEHSIRELKAEARVIERKERERLARADSVSDSNARPGLLRRESSSLGEDGPGKRGSMVGNPGLRELRLARRDSSSSVQSLRARRGQRPTPPEITVQTQQLPPAAASPRSALDGGLNSPSPPFSAVEETPISTSAPTGLAAPSQAMWHARTSSLATKEVLATSEHEVLPDEALLLELVNAKTSEAQSRAEVDELKRALLMSNRRHDGMLQALQAQVEAANAAANAANVSANAARMESQAAKDMAEAAKQESMALSSIGLSVPNTPGGYDSDNRSLSLSLNGEAGTPTAVGEKTLPEVPAVSPAPTPKKEGSGSGGGGWFWNRRTPSTTAKIAVTPPAE